MNYEHMVELRVRYDECDPMGFVHHANYMKYFEIARTDLYRALASGSVTLAVVDREGKLQRIPDTLRDPLTGS